MKNLDLMNNDVTQTENYRTKALEILPNLDVSIRSVVFDLANFFLFVDIN